MTWEKLGIRQSDFLKNCLLYEALEEQPLIFSFNYMLTVRQGMEFTHYWQAEDLEQRSQDVLERVIKDKNFIQWVVSSGLERASSMKRVVKRIPLLKLKNLSNSKLNNIFLDYCRTYKELYKSFLIALKDTTLGAKVRAAVDPAVLPELIAPTKLSAAAFEELEFLKLCSHVDMLLRQHHAKFAYLPTTNDQKPWPYGYFVKRLGNYLAEGKIQELLTAKREFRTKAIEKKKKLLAGMPTEFRQEINALSAFIWVRLYHRNMFCLAHYYSEPLFAEIAKRASLRENIVKFLTPSEISSFLLEGRQIDMEAIRERKKLCVLLLKEKRFQLFTGEPAKAFVSSEIREERAVSSSEAKGTVASKGYAKGRCCIVLDARDSRKIKPKDIIVTRMTTPDIVPLLRDVTAIVTDEGGITCHAAIISRELNKPCIIGTKIATKIFKDGDILEVDATNSVVRKIK